MHITTLQPGQARRDYEIPSDHGFKITSDSELSNDKIKIILRAYVALQKAQASLKARTPKFNPSGYRTADWNNSLEYQHYQRVQAMVARYKTEFNSTKTLYGVTIVIVT